MKLKASVNLLNNLVRNKDLSKNYAVDENKDLRRLSPKKDTALGCLLAGIDRVETIPDYIKTSWFNWIYYAMLMIKDEEVDALAESMARGLEEYHMAYFSQDFVNSLPEGQRKAAEAMLSPHLKQIKGETEMADSLKSWVIQMALKCKIDNYWEWQRMGATRGYNNFAASKIAKRIVTEIDGVPYREESNIFELIEAMLGGYVTERSELKDKV